VPRNQSRSKDKRMNTKNLLGGIIKILNLAKNKLEGAINVRESFLISRLPNKPSSNKKVCYIGRSHAS